MKKISKFFLSLILFSSVLLGSTNVSADSNGSQTYNEEELERSLNNIIGAIGENVSIDSKGLVLEEKEEVIENIDQKDIENLLKLAETQGINYTQTVTKESVVEMFEAGIQETDKAVEEGELTVLSNGSLIDAKDDEFYVQGGSTYDKSYWWGKKRYKSTYFANVWVRDLKSLGHANAAGAFVAAAIFGPIAPWAALPNGLTSAYLYNLADKVSYRNSLNSRGIIANLTYTLVFTTASQ